MAKERSAYGPEVRPPDDLISLHEAAELFGVSYKTVDRWCNSGKLPFWRVGGRRKVSKTDALAMIQPGEPKVKDKPRARGRWEQREIDRWTREVLERHGLRIGPSSDNQAEQPKETREDKAERRRAEAAEKEQCAKKREEMLARCGYGPKPKPKPEAGGPD